MKTTFIMCLIAFSYKQHPNYQIIFVANRDENYSRPTRAAGFWDENPNILAGKDLKAGGTWMGINKQGAFSAITNYRDPSIEKINPSSRGYLVLDYLKENGNPESYLHQIDQKADQYMGFSLLAGTGEQLGFYSNQQRKVKMLDPGLYGLSNRLLNTPWPKVQRAKSGLHDIIESGNISLYALFDLLTDDREASENELPDTGIPREIEKKVSPIFIKGENYGTRCSTVLLIDKHGAITFAERRFKAGTLKIDEESRYELVIDN